MFKLGELDEMSFGMLESDVLGETSFCSKFLNAGVRWCELWNVEVKVCELGELGAAHFKMIELGGLGEVSFGMIKLGVIYQNG